MTKYFFDDQRGHDDNSGLSPDSPFKSLKKANEIVCKPDDALLFRAGGRWEGQLALKGSGSPGAPCTLSAYGSGPRPRFDGCGQVEATILLHNIEQWEVRGLEVTNSGNHHADRRMGILAMIENYGTARHLLIEDNHVHDVNGCNVKAHGDWAGGIFWRAEGNETKSRYIDVKVRNNRLERCDRVGIYCRGMGSRDRWFPMLDVVIYGNELHDIGGDGILNIGTDGCLVERNRLIRGRVRDDMYCAGIWPWSSDHTVIRYNEVAGYVGTKDGQGFDCDYNCIGTTHMYNYSHDNEGGFMLVCSASTKFDFPEQIGTIGSRIHRNLSVNDLCRTFHIAGPVVGTVVSENCIYVKKGIDIPCMLVTGLHEPMGGPDDVIVTRNIFAARGTLRYARSVERYSEDGTFKFEDDPAIPGIIYAGNHYLGQHAGKPSDPIPPSSNLTLEDLEEIIVNSKGQARPGLETLDQYLELMGWPKSL